MAALPNSYGDGEICAQPLVDDVNQELHRSNGLEHPVEQASRYHPTSACDVSGTYTSAVDETGSATDQALFAGVGQERRLSEHVEGLIDEAFPIPSFISASIVDVDTLSFDERDFTTAVTTSHEQPPRYSSVVKPESSSSPLPPATGIPIRVWFETSSMERACSNHPALATQEVMLLSPSTTLEEFLDIAHLHHWIGVPRNRPDEPIPNGLALHFDSSPKGWLRKNKMEKVDANEADWDAIVAKVGANKGGRLRVRFWAEKPRISMKKHILQRLTVRNSMWANTYDLVTENAARMKASLVTCTSFSI